MKLMTYNILDGGEGRLEAIAETIRAVNPDFLTINEANGFDAQENKKLKEFAQKISLPHFHLSLSGEYDYHVAVFSKSPFKVAKEIKPLARAAILVVVDTEFGELCIVSTHLTPHSEDSRLHEIDLIISEQKSYRNGILMGDMNSLSGHDDYPESVIHQFNEGQVKKFTTDGKLRFDVINKIQSAGYFDSAIPLFKNKECTVPTPTNTDTNHSQLRLDYIFVTDFFKDKISSYTVIKNKLTNKASDHYPVTVLLQDNRKL